uniref:receptor-like protein kinase FERONIA n=1 Tax=Erigeron canadensis TaxID=72917 RepID=UPI001CB9C7B2|nr:receptor-like protein kinase FERONIA [Erigeron canadensis]
MSFFKDYDYLKIEMKKILSATNNFDSSKVIGSGGFGQVYKGELSLPEGPIMVAFKKLDRRLGQGNIEFWKEVMMLSKYKHENLISLMYYCIEGDDMILGYEYASRGSLDRYLNDASLTWTRRLKICVGAARGLNYLHDPRGGHERVLHRDIKSGNILLDENWMAKVSDFGLSKAGPANQAHSVLVSHPVGTPGYCDPLYWETGFVSKESDVYSFGVVLFEILCGRLCCEYNRKSELTNIFVPKWRRCYEEKTLDEIIFPGLKEQMDPGSLNAFSVTAYQCVKKAREERPMMAQVVKALEFALQPQDVFEVLGKKVDFETLIKIVDGALTSLLMYRKVTFTHFLERDVVHNSLIQKDIELYLK